MYRQVVQTNRKNGEKFSPSTSSFSLSEADKTDGYGLSTDWEPKTSPEDSIIRIGCSYKGNSTEFKNYKNRELYALELSFLKSFSEILDAIFSPIDINPPQFGKPSNPAHALVSFRKGKSYDEYAPLLFTKLRDHAKQRRIEFDMQAVENSVELYRKSNQ